VSLGDFVVLGGRGMNYGGMVKRVYTLAELGKTTCLGDRQAQAVCFCSFWCGLGE
jgi:hypothetical protein